MMKNILGLDLGTTSVGWALIKTDNNNTPQEIRKMGVRLVPLAENEADKFTKGQSNTINADRTRARGARRNYDRYQLRRQALTNKLRSLNMLPNEALIKLPILELWQLRANAVTKQVSLPELGRILYHLNQKRGYKHAKGENNDAKTRLYVQEINNRYSQLLQEGLTIGQHFAKKLKETAIINEGKVFYNFRIKDNIYPRKAYEDEYDAIMRCQHNFYPSIITDDVINEIKNNIIYYQRDLRSCKHLISVCEFEKRCFYDANGNVIRDKNGNIVYDGPRVTPRTSPLFQLFKDWQAVNNIRFRNKENEELIITKEQKQTIINLMDNQEVLKLKDVQNILEINHRKGWYCDKAIKNGIKGNSTLCAIKSVLSTLPKSKVDDITRFYLITEPTTKVDEETGEILVHIKTTYQDEPLYRLWHIIYSIKQDTERQEAIKKFLKEFDVTDSDIISHLSDLDFTTQGYGSLSAKAICKILPYMMEGLDYSDSCEYVGYNHSNSLTQQENENRELLDKIPTIKKNELRQPTVEKILNQTINVFNQINSDLIEKGERIDEVRIELARELKQSKDEREKTDKGIREQQKKNEFYAEKLREHGISPTRNRLFKYRLWEESHESCFYCNKPIDFCDYLSISEVEREHIIPKRLLFDDSFANQVCSCRKCNAEKGGRTAIDYMRTTHNLENYLNKVDEMFQKKEIGAKKRSHLLASYEDYLERKKEHRETKDDKIIWEEPIERQLRLSQYISSKAQEIIKSACREVTATSGSITDLLRHVWGYDTILHELNLPRYKSIEGLTEIKTDEKNGQKKEIIKGWTKRLDHRHHAIDALAIACTTHSMIQRINTLHASREDIRKEITSRRKDWDENDILLQWIKEKCPFDRSHVMQQVASILVSMKAGKKVTVPGKRKVYKNGKPITIQTGLRIPRGQLHEQTIYGAINVNGKQQIVTRYKMGVGSMGFVFNGKETCDVIYDKKNKQYTIIDGVEKAINYIVDKHIREVVKARLNEAFPEGETYKTKAEKALATGIAYSGKERCKLAFDQLRNLEENPLYSDNAKHIIIKSVKCFTGLSAVQPLRYNEKGKAISYVLTKNNHHVAIYQDENGKYHECIYTFWQMVERAKYNLPLIIKSPYELWEEIHKRTMDGQELPDELLASFPKPNWTFIDSLQRNEMFVMDMSDDEFNDNLYAKNYAEISKKLYRIQKIALSDYVFRLHTDTTTDNSPKDSLSKKFIRISSLKSYMEHKPHKITLSLLGHIIKS